MVDAKAGASAEGGGASGTQNAPIPPAEGGSTGSGAPKSIWGPKPGGSPPCRGRGIAATDAAIGSHCPQA
eukprot:1239526-Alexandrium_andersonii.AAC.1